MADSTDLHGRLGMGQLPLQDPEGLLGRIIRLYRKTVSEYICSEFQRRYPDEAWFMTRVIEKERGNPSRAHAVQLMVEKFREQGKHPSRIFDPGHFPFLVRNHQEVFGDLPINNVREQMHRIARIRNDYHGHDNEDLSNEIVEEAADKCAIVLHACGKGPIASDIGRMLQAGYEAPQTSFASPPPGIADDSPSAQSVTSVSKDDLKPALLRDGDLPGRDAHFPGIDALSQQDPNARGDLESAERERERWPFLGGVLARLRMSKASQSGSSNGDDWRGHKRHVLAAVDTYALAMSRYVNDRMIIAPNKADGKAHGKEWYRLFLGEVINDQKVKQGIREQYQKHLEQWKAGERNPSQDLEAGEFQWIVSRNSDAFPSQIRDLQRSLHTVSQKRNRATHNQRLLTPKDVDETIEACGRILRAIGNEAAARDIERLLRGRFWPLKWPFFGGMLARPRMTDAAQSGSGGGDGAFAAGGEVAQREPVRGRRRIPRILVGRALLAVILVGIAIAFGSAVSDLWPRGDQIELETGSATAPSGEQARQQESSAAEEQSATEGEGNGGGAPTPPADSGTESNGQDAAEPSSPESAQTPSGGAGEDEPSDSGDGGQAEAGSGEQPGTGGCTGDECPTESGQAPSGGAGGGGTSESDDDGQTGAGDGEQTGAGGCTGDECSTESGQQQESPGQAPSSDAGGGGTSDSGVDSQTGAGGGEEPGASGCNGVTYDDGTCSTDGESETSDSGGGGQTGAGGGEEPGETECSGVTYDDGSCSTDGGGGTSDSGEDSLTEEDGADDGDGAIDPESDTMDDDENSPGSSALEGEEPGTTIVTADDGNPIAPIVVAEDNPIAYINDDGLQPDALEEEEPGTTIVVAEDNPIIITPTPGLADDDLMEDVE